MHTNIQHLWGLSISGILCFILALVSIHYACMISMLLDETKMYLLVPARSHGVNYIYMPVITAVFVYHNGGHTIDWAIKNCTVTFMRLPYLSFPFHLRNLLW